MIAPVQDCCSCRFWQNIPTGTGGQGHCRRHAPVLVAVTYVDGLDRLQSEAHQCWPVTGEAEWCGEHEPAPAIAAGDAALEALAPSPMPGPHPEPPWPAGGVENNGRREGWNAFFQGLDRTRESCPFPPARDDLWVAFQEGWNAANEATP